MLYIPCFSTFDISASFVFFMNKHFIFSLPVIFVVYSLSFKI